MNYLEALEWVHSLGRMAGRPGLERMEQLMGALGDPQQELKFVHVAGTNGKGSAVMMTASILKEAGYRTGANISPFVLDFRERFLIDGEMVEHKRLAQVLTKVRRAAETLEVPPLEFEVVTAAALVYFAEEKCDIVCLECGMGGKNDYTNIIENTVLAYIMRVGYDHMEVLGSSLTAIAAEKCGIFKNRCPVICYPEQPQEAMLEILKQASEKECPLTVPNVGDIVLYKGKPLETRINYGGYEVYLPFPGRHQALNAAVVIEGVLELWRHGYAIEDEHIVRGIEKTRFPARIEVLRRKPLFILDGAHNEDSAHALAAALCAAKLDGLTAVAGILDDKQADGILSMLAPYISTLYAVAPPSPRAIPAEQLADIARKYIRNSYVCDDVETALELAQEDGNQVLVFGSLYLASQVRGMLVPGSEKEESE